MKIRLSQFLRRLPGNLSLFAPVLLLLAIAAGAAAVSSARSAAKAVSKIQHSVEATRVQLEKEPISPEIALASARRLAMLAPNVTVAVKGARIIVSMKTDEQFTDWLYAMTALQSTAADVVWEAEDLCLGHCADGAARAVVVGYRQHLIAR